MTAVQLPEVPAPIGHLHSDDDFCRTVPVYPDLWPVDVYTAAQLRECATEAVRQAANAIFAEGWYLACDWASRDDLKFDVDSPAFEADRAARLGNLFTPSEPNSDR